MAATEDLVLRLDSIRDIKFEGQLVTVFAYSNGHTRLSFHAHPTRNAWVVFKEGIGTVMATYAIDEFSRLIKNADFPVVDDIQVLKVSQPWLPRVNRNLPLIPARASQLR